MTNILYLIPFLRRVEQHAELYRGLFFFFFLRFWMVMLWCICLMRGWILLCVCSRQWNAMISLCWSSAPVGQTAAFTETPGNALCVALLVATLPGILFHHIFTVFCFTFVHAVASAPQETLNRICCLVIVTFMEISLNFKRTKHLSLVTGFKIMNSSEKVD